MGQIPLVGPAKLAIRQAAEETMQNPMANGKYACVCGHKFFSEENGMAKGKGSNGGRSAPKNGKQGG
jgi:hypothetical protein